MDGNPMAMGMHRTDSSLMAIGAQFTVSDLRTGTIYSYQQSSRGTQQTNAHLRVVSAQWTDVSPRDKVVCLYP